MRTRLRPLRALLGTETFSPWTSTTPRYVTSVADPAMAVLDAVQSSTGLPWWATLATGGAAVRLSLYPLTRKGQQAGSVVVSAFQEAQRQVSTEAVNGRSTASTALATSATSARPKTSMKEEKQRNRRRERLDVLRRARALIRADPHATSPLWVVGAPLAQLSVLIYSLYSVRYMAKAGYEGFASGGPSWAMDLTLPAVDVGTMTAPLGVVGAMMPAVLMGGFLVSISKLRPPVNNGDDKDNKNKNSQVSDSEMVRRWAMGHLAMGLEVLTIPLLFGVLTSPQAVLYYWASSMWAGLGAGKVLEQRMMAANAMFGDQRNSSRESPPRLSAEAQDLLNRAAMRVAEGAHAEALGYLKQARILAPRHPSVHMALGDVLASLPGKTNTMENAETAYRAAIAEARSAEATQIPGMDALSQRATFALGMLLSRPSDERENRDRKQEALELLEKAASKLDDGDEFKPVAVRALLGIAALSDDKARRRDALASATSASPEVASRLRQGRKGTR